jgi:hypothetical protein
MRIPRAAELFGSPTVTVTASAAGSWPQLVAVLSSVRGGTETVVAAGGIPTGALGRARRPLVIRLSSWSAPLPRGSTLKLTLAQTSVAQSPDTPIYLLAKPAGQLRVHDVRLSLPVLR